MFIKILPFTLCIFLFTFAAGGCAVLGSMEIKGPEPIFPTEACIGATVITDRQPTFVWNGKKGMTYDFILSEAVQDGPGKYSRGKTLHQESQIKGNSYRPPVNLQYGQCYKWSVKETGQKDWSGRSTDGVVIYLIFFKTAKERNEGYTIYVAEKDKTFKYNLSLSKVPQN